MKLKGTLFIIEGSGDGCGKTTLIKLLQNHYDPEGKGDTMIFTREPGGTELAEKIRTMIFDNEMHPHTEALLFAASRSEHIFNKIIPALEEGKIVICDRYLISSLVYQGGKLSDYSPVLKYNSFIPEEVHEATKIIFLDTPVDVLHKRINNRIDEQNRLDAVDLETIIERYKEYHSVLIKLVVEEFPDIETYILDNCNNYLNDAIKIIDAEI